MISHPALGGTDGFRGLATSKNGPGLMNPETVAGLTYALIQQTTEGNGGGLVVIGRDTRPSGHKLELAAISGALTAGAEVIRLGVAPTPAVLKTAKELGANAGVIITASHNKYTDNGWKGTIGSDKPYGRQVRDIDERYWDQVDSGLVIPLRGRHTETRPELIGDYIEDVASNIEAEFGENPLAGTIFVSDTANGAAMDVTPLVLRRLGATVEEFACDGAKPINEGTGATDLSGVQAFLQARPELVRDPRFRGVLANDGDADRMIGMGVDFDADGNMIFSVLDGNRVIELMSVDQPGVVGTEYTNNASIDRLQAAGRGFKLCPNGDVSVALALRNLGWTRGGEFTGHHIDLNWLSSGDGVRTAAWVAAFTAKNGTTIAEINKSLPLWPEKMHKLKVKRGMGSMALADPKVVRARMISDEEDAEGLRFVVHKSGTEQDIVRVWGVGRVAEVVDYRTQQIVDAMAPYIA